MKVNIQTKYHRSTRASGRRNTRSRRWKFGGKSSAGERIAVMMGNGKNNNNNNNNNDDIQNKRSYEHDDDDDDDDDDAGCQDAL